MGQDGIVGRSATILHVNRCLVANAQYAVRASSGGKVLVENCSGTGNVYGHYAGMGGTMHIVDGTHSISGTTQYYHGHGGIIFDRTGQLISNGG